VKLWFEEREHENVQSHQTVDGDRGVVEIRTCTRCDDIGWLRERHPGWRDLTSIGRVVLVRDDDGKTRPRTRYFISSLALDAKFLAHAVRSHRVIENDLHWVLDVSFREDDSRVRKDNGPANLAVIRHAAMNVLRRSRGRISPGECGRRRDGTTGSCWNSSPHDVHAIPLTDQSSSFLPAGA